MLLAVVAAFMSVAMADSSPADVYTQCKQDAASAEVPAAEMDDFIQKCMEDNGVDAADIDKAMKSK